MKKITLLIIGMFFYLGLNAQTPITITELDMPNENDSVLVSVNSTVGSSDPALTGANYNWDYSSLIPTTQQFEKFDSPQTFTSPFNFLFNTNNTSYGRDNYEFASIALPGGTQISEAYDFFKETTTQFKQIGAGYTVNGIPIPFLYAPVDVIYTFPMNHLNADSCDYKYGLNIPGMGYYGQSGHRVNQVDGWGTITTPFGTFQTLRIKSSINAVDTIFYNSFGFGTKITRPLKYEFKWLATGMKIPVLKIEANLVGGNISVSAVRYIDSSRADVPQVGIIENAKNKLELTVFPNPCVNEVILQYNLSSTSFVKIGITNLIGKNLVDIVDGTQKSGLYRKLISIKDFHLTPGIYFINLQTNNRTEIQKIVVTN